MNKLIDSAVTKGNFILESKGYFEGINNYLLS